MMIGISYTMNEMRKPAPRGRAAYRSAFRRGFSLIEAMVGMVVLVIVLTNLVAVVPATVGYASESSVQIQAIGAAQDYLDTIRQYIKTNGIDTGLPPPPVIPIDSGTDLFGNSSRSSLGNFVETPDCSARSLFTFDCKVTVSWSQGGNDRSVQVESYIASQAGF
jgi:prepilin-type N-terminal cleavage/methylation domain-containing protein